VSCVCAQVAQAKAHALKRVEVDFVEATETGIREAADRVGYKLLLIVNPQPAK